MKTLSAAALLFVSACAAADSGFEGRWIVSVVDVLDHDSAWSSPDSLPAVVQIKKENDRLLALYTDRRGVTLACSTFREIIEGHEAILFGCPAPTKSSTILSPLHRLKLQGHLLKAYTVTDRLVYTWLAEREVP